MTKEHAYAYEAGYQDGLKAGKNIWHKMIDVRPTDENGTYLLLGIRGAMYLAKGYHVWPNGSRSFYIPNNRSPYMDFEKVKAWASVPEYEEG